LLIITFSRHGGSLMIEEAPGGASVIVRLPLFQSNSSRQI